MTNLDTIKRAAIRAVVVKHKAGIESWLVSPGRAQGLVKDPERAEQHTRRLIESARRQIERVKQATTVGELHRAALSWGRGDYGLHSADGDLTELLLKALVGEPLVLDPHDDD